MRTGNWMRGTTLAAALAITALGLGGAAMAADTDIVITEIMQNPNVLADADGEWFEIHNTGGTDVDIEGWTVMDNGYDSFVIASGGPLIVPAGAYAVIGNNATAMAGEGVTLLYEYVNGTDMYLGIADD